MVNDLFGDIFQIIHHSVTGERIQCLDLLPAVDAGDFFACLFVNQLFQGSADVAHMVSRTMVAPGTECVSVFTGPLFGG